MSLWLNDEQLSHLHTGNENADFLPIPTKSISDGEHFPAHQTPDQKRVQFEILEQANALAAKRGIDRRQFMGTASGLAVAFMALNKVFGPIFEIDPAEAADDAAALERLSALANQFIFDAHTHHVRKDYAWDGQLFLFDFSSGKLSPEKLAWNPANTDRGRSLEYYMFDHYLKDVFFDSQTSVAMLSTSPSVEEHRALLSDDQMVASRNFVNEMAGTKRMYAHGTIWPTYPEFLDGMDRSAQELKIDAWKGYTIGDPLGLVPESLRPWRLDDEDLTYKAYEKCMKYGIKNLCIHKGLMPADDYTTFENWRHAAVDDVAKAAKDWPELNFIIYHSAVRPFFDMVKHNREFEETGRLPWVDELAEIPEKHGVTNVYGEVGLVFAQMATSYPRCAASMFGKLIKGLGADHVIWGTDSVWFGSPQWQIDAFRRLQMPDDLQEKYGYAPLGPADGPVKTNILGANYARLFGHEPTVAPYRNDKLAQLKAGYEAAGAQRDNVFWGWMQNIPSPS
jgi:predicted TIM-barrel fold metal-dependent hydrolase